MTEQNQELTQRKPKITTVRLAKMAIVNGEQPALQNATFMKMIPMIRSKGSGDLEV